MALRSALCLEVVDLEMHAAHVCSPCLLKPCHLASSCIT